MSKKVQQLLKIIATLAFAGLLLCIGFDLDKRLELLYCTIAALCSYLVFFSKRGK